MSQGLIIVVLGIVAMWLVLSGKLNCIITAFRACAGSQSSAGSGAIASGQIGVNPGTIISNVVSPNVVN